MLVLTRKNRESVVIGRPEDLEIVLEITILEIEGGRVRLGFTADTKMPIHRREVWDRICNGVGHAGGNGNGNGHGNGSGHANGNGQSAGVATVTVTGRTFASRGTSMRADGGPA
jgi:carbon storage regulator CsrA